MAKQSLLAKSQPAEAQTALTLPTPGGLANMPVPEQTESSPYVWFASSKAADRWPDVRNKIPSLAEGDPVLIQPDVDPIKCHPLEFFLLDGFRYFAMLDAEFKPHRAWAEKPEGVDPTEFISALMLVCHNGKLTPATCRFRGPKCKAFHTARAAFEEASAPGWSAKSPEHALTLTIPQPNLRFKVSLSVSAPKKARSGFSYQTATAKILPTSAGDVTLFSNVKDNAEFAAVMSAVQESFEKWNAGIRSLIK